MNGIRILKTSDDVKEFIMRKGRIVCEKSGDITLMAYDENNLNKFY
jgi:hypothetical protein